MAARCVTEPIAVLNEVQYSSFVGARYYPLMSTYTELHSNVEFNEPLQAQRTLR